jgi:RNA polymerase sigma-70 factor (ECF subfamily)
MVTAARRGEDQAMRRLLEHVTPALHRFSLGFCRDPLDAEETMQDVLVSLIRTLDRFRGDATLASWTYAVARRVCARRRRRRAGEPIVWDSLDAPGRRSREPAATRTAEPLARMEQAELREVLERTLASLPEADREVLVLRDVEGLESQEAARALGVSEAAFKSRLHRARQAMRRALAPYLQSGDPVATPGCPDTARLLSRYLEGEIDTRTCASIEAHVRGCQPCQGACRALQETLRACRRLGTRKLPRTLRTRVRRAIEAAVRSSEGRRARSAPRPPRSARAFES